MMKDADMKTNRPWTARCAPTLLACIALAFAADALAGGAREGAFIAEIEDDDADALIVMETDWISMRIMPAIQATVIRFVFRPTQNEIVEITQPKNLMSGGGLLKDNLWEQDWRFQEFRGRPYDYQITKTGPEEVQVVFETQVEGWLGADQSGITSRLLEDLIIRRTVTLRQGSPYFLFDMDFINPDRVAKMPQFWCHNSSRINLSAPDRVRRPSSLEINTIPSSTGQDYIHDFVHGWSARISPERREGLVYLMDYDYVQFLYNCGITTSEWIYDNLLILPDRPVRTRIYVIPTMGLEKVDHATEFFITQLKPRREGDRLILQYQAVSSYETARRITFVPELVHDLLEPEPRHERLAAIEFTELGIEPTLREVVHDGPIADPLVIRTTAFVDLADGTQEERNFEYFHVGDYAFGRNIRRDMATPVTTLERRPQQPHLPMPSETLDVNRRDFRIFALLGNHSRILGLEQAIGGIGAHVELQVGYHPGYVVARTGLTDFPYDYERLFDFRAVVLNNALFDPARYVGLHILHNYLMRGGGLVYGGGENTFGMMPHNQEHPINEFLPLRGSRRIRKAPAQLNSPVSNHPVFNGVDLSQLPWQYYVQEVEFKDDLPVEPDVLLKVGDQPFLIEYAPVDGQRTMVVLALPYGRASDHPERPPLWKWESWNTLYANIVRYAGHDL